MESSREADWGFYIVQKRTQAFAESRTSERSQMGQPGHNQNCLVLLAVTN
jgi:hypothetical protein